MLDQLDCRIDSYLAGGGFAAQAAFRLVLALLAGGLVGLERESRGREAGFRTNLLVCMGSALAMIVSYRMMFVEFPQPAPRGDITFQVDPARIAYGVMTGVGFLGAGAILRVGVDVRGLTTAAGLWCVAAIGLAMGQGLYVVGAFATVLVFLSLWLLHRTERFPRRRIRRIVVRLPWSDDALDRATAVFVEAGHHVMEYEVHRRDDQAEIAVLAAFWRQEDYEQFERSLLRHPHLALVSAMTG